MLFETRVLDLWRFIPIQMHNSPLSLSWAFANRASKALLSKCTCEFHKSFHWLALVLIKVWILKLRSYTENHFLCKHFRYVKGNYILDI